MKNKIYKNHFIMIALLSIASFSIFGCNFMGSPDFVELPQKYQKYFILDKEFEAMFDLSNCQTLIKSNGLSKVFSIGKNKYIPNSKPIMSLGMKKKCNEGEFEISNLISKEKNESTAQKLLDMSNNGIISSAIDTFIVNKNVHSRKVGIVYMESAKSCIISIKQNEYYYSISIYGIKKKNCWLKEEMGMHLDSIISHEVLNF